MERFVVPKTLSGDSKYNIADLDGDGIVTDEELQLHQRMLQIENDDAMQDQQRLMAWVAMLFVIIVVAVQYTPLVSLDRISATMGFVNTVVVAMLGVVATFMTTSAWAKRK